MTNCWFCQFDTPKLRPRSLATLAAAALTAVEIGGLNRRKVPFVFHATVANAKEKKNLRAARDRLGLPLRSLCTRSEGDNLSHPRALASDSQIGESILIWRLGPAEG